MHPSITFDSSNEIITLSAGQRTIIITSSEVTSTEVPTEMETLAHAILMVIATALVAAFYMLVFAVAFGGRYLDEIKQSIEKGTKCPQRLNQ